MSWFDGLLNHKNLPPAIPTDAQGGIGVDDDGNVVVRVPAIPILNRFAPGSSGFWRWIDVPLVADGVTVRVGHARMVALLEELARDGWPIATTPPPPDDEPLPPRPQ